MEGLIPKKETNSSKMLSLSKLKGLAGAQTISDKNSSKLETLVNRKMSNKIKKMGKRIKSLIVNKKKVEKQKTIQSKLSAFKTPIQSSHVSEDVSPVSKYFEADFKSNPYVFNSPVIQQESDSKLLEEQESTHTRTFSAKPNVYDSMEEEDDLVDEEKETRNRLKKISYYLTFLAEIGVFLSLVVGYLITRREEDFGLPLIFFAIAADLAIAANILFSAYIHFRSCINLKTTLIRYLLTWAVVDLVSCFPVSISILVKNVELARANLLFLIFRVVLFKKPRSVFGNWIITPNNLETNRLIKTFFVFSATIFYFAIYFRFIVERELSLVDCLYFVVVTSISVGYGDITPTDTKERLFTMVIQVVGLIFYTLFISMVSGYISAMTPKKIRLKEQKDILFEIYCDFDVPLPLYQTIKEHLNTSKDDSNSNMVDLIKSLPITVSRELLDNTFKPTLERTPFFAKLSSNLASEMLSCINYIHYEKDEIVLQTGQLCEEVLIVSKGRLKFFSTLHDQRFALARMGSGQTFGEAQCFLKEQAICSLVNVSSIYKGFIIRSQDFDRLADEYKEEIGVLVNNSLTKHECLKCKLKFLKHCEKYDMTTEEIQHKIDKINMFISDLEGEVQSITKAVNNYTKKHMSYLTNNRQLQKIERVKCKRLKENINQATKLNSPLRKKKTELIQNKMKEKLAVINTNINSSPINESANFLSRRVSVFQSPEKRPIEIFTLTKKQSTSQENNSNTNFSTINSKLLSRIEREGASQASPGKKLKTSTFSKGPMLSKNKYKSEEIFVRAPLGSTLKAEPLDLTVPLGKQTVKDELTIKLNRSKKFQVISVDGLSIEVKINEKVIQEVSEREELNAFEEMIKKLEDISKLLETTG